MINTVLCPLDFSPLTELALGWAKRLASQLQVPIRLVHVVPPAPLFAADPEVAMALAPIPLPDPAQREACAADLLKPMANDLLAAGLEVRTELYHGEPEKVLADLVAQDPTLLTVMGTHGYAAIPRFLLGSVTVEVMRRAVGPVLAVRAPQAQAKLERIGVAVDFSAACEPAIALGASLARACDAELQLIHVGHMTELLGTAEAELPTYLARIDAAVRETAHRELGEIAQRLKGVRVQTRVRMGSSCYRELVVDAQEQGLSLLVMGTHGRTGLTRLFLGSVTERTMQLAPCPVLAIRSPSEVPAELSWRDVAEDLQAGDEGAV